MAGFTVQNRAMEFLGTEPGYRELEDTGVFYRCGKDGDGNGLSLLVPDNDELIEINFKSVCFN